jgi:pyruvate dehydrogenase E1 component alpha subunit
MWIKPESLTITQVQVLNEVGELVGEVPDLTEVQLVDMYRHMIIARTYDERVVRLQRQGRVGTYAPFSGQEAAQVGSAYALEKSDWLFPSYREVPALWMHGLPLENSLLYTMGHVHGARWPEGVNAFPVQIIIAGQTTQVMGSAWASKYLNDNHVSLCYLGDGATSQGDFHESLNFASVFKLPAIYFIQNNQWAISMPRSRQSGSQSLAQKGLAYGIPSVQVDGNDVLAVYKVTQEAVQRARSGEGPSVIEAVTFRLGAHTTSDDPTRYRTQEELEAWRQKDPLLRFRRFLMERQLWDTAREQTLLEEAAELIEQVVVAAEGVKKGTLEESFDYVYANLTPHLREQKAAVVNKGVR